MTKLESLLDDPDDEEFVDSRFVDDETIVESSKDNKLYNRIFEPRATEILSDQWDEDTEEIEIEMDDGDTFEITRQDDPMYDLYPRSSKRPIDLFKAPVYDRQIGESLTDYQRFLTYAAIPAGNRSIKLAWSNWHNHNENQVSDKPSGVFRDTAMHWRWEERAYALDLQRNRVVQQIWIERDVERREEDWNAGSKLREKADQALDKLDIEDLGPSAIAKFFALASDLQKESIPDSGLDKSQLTEILNSLPADRRNRVIEIVAAKVKIQ